MSDKMLDAALEERLTNFHLKVSARVSSNLLPLAVRVENAISQKGFGTFVELVAYSRELLASKTYMISQTLDKVVKLV